MAFLRPGAERPVEAHPETGGSFNSLTGSPPLSRRLPSREIDEHPLPC